MELCFRYSSMMLTVLGYNPQLFHEILSQTLLWRYFVDVVQVHNQLTFSERDYPAYLGEHDAMMSMLKDLTSRDFLEEADIPAMVREKTWEKFIISKTVLSQSFINQGRDYNFFFVMVSVFNWRII